ncbi:hypothetical protein TNCV_3770731 [Trichonephila clavipes]|nr:hypothetical protein TNCV_3770731 [Trichonephila clavipes]
MATSGSSFNPTPLAHADNLEEGHPRGSPLQPHATRALYIYDQPCFSGIRYQALRHNRGSPSSGEYRCHNPEVPYVEVEELEPDLTVKFALKEGPTNYPKGHLRALAPTRFRKSGS